MRGWEMGNGLMFPVLGVKSNEITIPDSPDFTLGTQDFTIEMHVKIDADCDTGDNACIIIAHNNLHNGTNHGPEKWVLKWSNVGYFGLGSGFFLHLNGGNFEWLINHHDSSVIGRWIHLAMVREGSNFNSFIDVTLVATDTFSGSFDDMVTPITIGSSEDGFYFDGNISQVHFASYAH